MTDTAKASALPARQQPRWAAGTDVRSVVERLRARRGLVSPTSCHALQRELTAVAAGAALVVQAGDCAERFADASPEAMRAKIDLLAHLADLVESSTGLPTVRVGRFAGQYAKPRSQDTERTADGRVLPVYRGDAVNAPEATAAARICDPARLLTAYDHATQALDELFLGELLPPFAGPDAPFCVTYAGHEALLLDYEEALVREDSRRGTDYGSSGHFLWIGERTRQPDGAHIAFAERISNPVGVKVGPDADGQEIASLVTRLASGRPPGRLSLIVRMGSRITTELPRLLDRLGETAERALWLCDPMHGNTRLNAHGQKTRLVSDIIAEVHMFRSVLRERGLRMAGLHLETTPEPVVECVHRAADLRRRLDRYTSACDPRLNARQAEAVVRAAVDKLSGGRP